MILMLGRAPAGMLSTYLGRSRCIIISGMAAAFLAPLGMLLFPFPAALVVFRAFSGLTAAIWPVLTAMVVNQCGKADMPHMISRCNLYNAFGNIFGMLLGGWLVGRFSQNAAFLGAALLGATALLLSFFMQEGSGNVSVSVSFKAIFQTAKDARLIFLSLIVAVFQIVITGTAMTFTPVLAEQLGATAENLGFLTMLSMLGMLLASMSSVWVMTTLKGPKTAVTASLVIFSCTTALIGRSGDLYSLYFLQLLQGFSGYMVMVILMGDSLLPYDQSKRAAASGVFQSIFAAGMFLGPIISGILFDIVPLTRLYMILSFLAIFAAAAVVGIYDHLNIA